MITVTTPMGITTQSTSASAVIRRDVPGIPPPGPASVIPYPVATPIQPIIANGTISRSMTPHGLHSGHGQPPFDPSYSPGLRNHPQTTAAASFLGNLNNKNPAVEKQPAAQFNNAIQYLNKIKARYSDDPNMYKQFLDILQTYQKEQRHLQDVSTYLAIVRWLLPN